MKRRKQRNSRRRSWKGFRGDVDMEI